MERSTKPLAGHFSKTLRRRFAPFGLTLAALAASSFVVQSAQAASWVFDYPLTTARYVHTAALLPDGTVLVAGGSGGNRITDRAENYDPAINSVTETCSNTIYVAEEQLLRVSIVHSDGSIQPFANRVGLMYGLAIDRAGNLYVAGTGDDTIRKVTPSGAVSVLVANPSLGSPHALAVDSKGNVYSVSSAYGTMSRISPAGQVTPFVSGLNGGAGLAVDADDNLYTASGSNIVKITPAGVVGSYLTGMGYTWGLAFDRNGNLFAAVENSLKKISPAGVISNLPVVLPNLASGFACDSDGNVFFGNLGDGTLRKISSDGATMTTVATGLDYPTAVAIWTQCKSFAIVTFNNLAQTYDGTHKIVSVTTVPLGLSVELTYNGSTNAPINAGSYTVIGTIYDPNYQGSTTNTLIVGKAAGTVTLSNLVQTYDGTAKRVSVATAPLGLLVNVTYNGSTNAPTDVGSYAVVGTINNQNYQGGATNTLVIVVPFVTNDPLNTARWEHTATLLSNGKVLIAGGNDGSNVLTSAEVYDSATGKWTLTNALTIARWGHTATLLPNGKVLVVGGYNLSTGYLSSAELYDPVTGMWTGTDGMSNARLHHTATLLPDGKVLVVGGYNSASNYLSSAELYDPITGMWTPTGAMTITRSSHTATLLPNGQVLVVGGYYFDTNIGVFLSSAEMYDPPTGTWTATGRLSIARTAHTATLLPNGKVLVVGGGGECNNCNNVLSSAELYDPAAGIWTNTSALTTARWVHTATLLPNGKLLVAGGFNNTNGSLSNAEELYDSATGTWTATASLNTARGSHTATLLASGRVLIAGGATDGNGDDILSSAELYDSANGTWTMTGSLKASRSNHTATFLQDGQVLVAGGYFFGALANAELYNPAVGTWTTTNSLKTERWNHTATLLPSGQVLVTGGYGNTSGGLTVALSSAELYDPPTGTWMAVNSLINAREGHTATLLSNGKVLVVGGAYFDYVHLTNVYPSVAELYDPATGTWAATGDLNTARTYHAATLLPNGKVLVAGGYNFYNGLYLSSAELYDPATGKWTVTGSLNSARHFHTATLLPSGQVLVVGGLYLSSAELYDPVGETWAVTRPLSIPRYEHTATLLQNGKVLVTGGNNATTSSGLFSTELYDPATRTWTTVGRLPTAHATHTATLLLSGKVLVAGGTGIRAELYDGGLGFSNSWQPQIASLTSPLFLGSSLAITGSQFRGVSGASGGNTQDSPTDYPVVQLRSVESGQTLFLPPTHWSKNSFTSTPVTNFPPGYAMVTMFVNGIPSKSSIVAVLNPCDVGTTVNGPSTVSPGVAFVQNITVTNFGPGTADNVVVSCPVPTGLTFFSATGNGQFSNGVITWNVGTLAAGGGSSFSVTFKAPATGSFTNVVTAASSTPDTNPANDSSQAITTVTGGSFSSIVGRPTLNPLTGAYEELVTVTNIGNPLVAVRLLVGNLPTQVSLHNATGTNNGKPYVEYTVAMNTGDSRTFLLQFVNPYRLNFTNTVEVIAVLPQTPATNTTAGVPISRVVMDTSIPGAPRFTFAFSSIPGRSYQILFSDDGMQTWSVANTITASANWTVWTEMLPAAESRFFKAILRP